MPVSILTIAVLCLLIGGSAALYLLPLVVGCVRRVPDLGAVAALNILLGWTLIFWVVSLAMALRTVRSAPPAVQVVQNIPPGQVPSAGWSGPPGIPPASPGPPPPLTLPPHSGTGPAGRP
jgi:Superinfection immunity protein